MTAKNVNAQLADEENFGGCFGRCKRAYFVKTQRNTQRFDWVCKFCRQRTVMDYRRSLSNSGNSNPSDIQTEEQMLMERKNSQNVDAVQRLGDRLGLDQEQIINVRRLQPVLCQRCYRVRSPISRTQLQLEMLSYWVYFFCLRWWWLLLLGAVKKSMSFFQSDMKLQQFGEALDESRSDILKQMQCPYSREVTKVMPGTKEIKKLFSDQEVIWYLVEKSKYDLTPRGIRRIVESQILKKAHDRDYERDEFYNKICGKRFFMVHKKRGKSKSRKDASEWNRMKPYAKLWFKAILDNTRNSIHLSHTKLSAFSSVKLLENLLSDCRCVDQVSVFCKDNRSVY